MLNRIVTGIYLALLFFLLSLIFISSAKAIDVDLEPINFTFNPEYPSDGEAVDIAFEVVNYGNETATNVGIVVWNSTSECDLEDDCVAVFETTENFIEKGKSAFFEFSCKPDGFDGCSGVGDHVLTLSVDYEDEIEETDDDNNKIVYEYTVFDGELPDLKVIDEDFSIIFTPEVPAAGDYVDILVFFENSGRESCTEFKIRFDQTLGEETSTIEAPRFYAIAEAGSTAQFNITWQPEEVGTYQITVFLDSDNDIEEYSDDDNTISKELRVRPHTPALTIK